MRYIDNAKLEKQLPTYLPKLRRSAKASLGFLKSTKSSALDRHGIANGGAGLFDGARSDISFKG